ncbi:MAG: sigma-70 family RNA polymerase sigma factor [Bacteroidetes bacterium]|nr:sigma-70 family RNA polymerase sigma factor [Bacteroidota bacterium]
MTTTHKNLTDEYLLQKYKETGDNGYMGILFKRYAHLICGLCYKYIPDETEAEDKMMDIFELALKKINNQEITYFKSWIFIVSKNFLLREIERKKGTASIINFDEKKSLNESVEFMDDAYLNDIVDGEIKIRGTVSKQEEIRNAVDTLVGDQKTCIQLFYYNKLSYQEISSQTGLELNMVKSHIQNGKKRLKNILQIKE